MELAKSRKPRRRKKMAALRRLLLSVGYGPDRLRGIWEESHKFHGGFR